MEISNLIRAPFEFLNSALKFLMRNFLSIIIIIATIIIIFFILRFFWRFSNKERDEETGMSFDDYENMFEQDEAEESEGLPELPRSYV